MIQYQPVRKLKAAGQGDVWEATQVGTQKTVALKYMRSDDATHESIDRGRFVREVRAQSQLKHRGVMPILAFNFDAEPPFYIMPMAAESLQDRLDAGQIPDHSELTHIVISVMTAVQHAHDQGIIHRDLKPANILRLPSADPWSAGEWVVADFGLCRDTRSDSVTITRADVALGSMAYMAPEQFVDAHRVGPTADVFALGKILFHCLTLDPGFPHADIRSLPTQYQYFVSKAISQSRADRYSSVARMLEDLQTLSNFSATSNPREQAATLIAQFRATADPIPAHALAQLLVRNQGDEQLFADLVPLVDDRVLMLLQAESESNYRIVVSAFDRACSGAFPFDFTDRIADLFAAIYRQSTAGDLRALALNRILTVGYEHNRFYVRNVFCQIAASTSGAEAAMVASLLWDSPERRSFIAAISQQFTYAPAISDALAAPPF